MVAPGSNGKGRAIGLALFGAAVAMACAAGGCGTDDDTEPPTPGVRRIVSLSRAGSVSCGGQPPISFSFDDGAVYAELRKALLDPANFGPAGVVPVTFVMRPSIDRVRPRALGRADVLVVNNSSGVIDETALGTIADFVAAGGSVISLGDDAATFMAKKGDCVADPEADVAGDAAAPGPVSAVLAGPFGTVSGRVFTGYNCAYSEIAPGVTVLAQNDKGPNALVLDAASAEPRAGRAVAFGDDEIFSSVTTPMCGSGKLTPGSANEVLALNTFAFLALARPSNE
jgi:hypothetical protein